MLLIVLRSAHSLPFPIPISCIQSLDLTNVRLLQEVPLEMFLCQKFFKILISFSSSQFVNFQNEIGIDGGMVDLPEPVGEVMTLTEKLYVPKKEFPDVSEIRESRTVD